MHCRLSTIRTADKIVAIKDGQVVETGSHEELMESKGLYYSLVLAQTNQEFDSLDNTEYEGMCPEKNMKLSYWRLSKITYILFFK